MDVPETGEFCIVGTVHTNDGETFAQQGAILMQNALNEPGIIHYCMAPDSKDPNTIHVFERYENKQAFDRHMATEWVKGFMARDLVKGANLDVCRPAQKRS